MCWLRCLISRVILTRTIPAARIILISGVVVVIVIVVVVAVVVAVILVVVAERTHQHVYAVHSKPLHTPHVLTVPPLRVHPHVHLHAPLVPLTPTLHPPHVECIHLILVMRTLVPIHVIAWTIHPALSLVLRVIQTALAITTTITTTLPLLLTLHRAQYAATTHYTHISPKQTSRSYTNG